MGHWFERDPFIYSVFCVPNPSPDFLTSPEHHSEVNVCKGITATGYMLAVIGVTVTFVKSFAPHLLK